ncbi:MAG TPA: hypothetical protein DIW31_09530 [Bacteroidales bacterium]|nr:hypothetical protein [Bacteroidales bacterium]
MESKSNPMYKSAMTSGLFLGIALVVFSLIIYMMGVVKPPFWVSLVQYLIIIGGIVYGTKKFRDEDLGGEISYSKALGFGILICIFASVISGIYTVLLMTVIDPEFVNKMMAVLEEEYVKAGLSEEQIDAAMKMVSKMQSPIIMAVTNVIGFAFMGTIFSLITSAFIKKEKPIFETPSEPKTE